MQHSTHNHTPTPTTITTTTSAALDDPGQEQPEKTPTLNTREDRVSSQDPTACRTLRPYDPQDHESDIMFHPATPQHTLERARLNNPGVWN
jgi:hypothetical protein